MTEDGQAQLVAKEAVPEYQKYAHLKGNAIWIGEAARKYKILRATISNWVKRGIITRLRDDGNRVLIDEADIAYCAELYHKNDGGAGIRLFNLDATPYRKKTRTKGS